MPKRGKSRMLVIVYFDWFGKHEDFERYKKAREKACAEIEGVKHLGTYASHQARYHYAFIEEWNSYDRRREISQKLTNIYGPRDRSILTHASFEVFTKM
jgi:hypothetical protein